MALNATSDQRWLARSKEIKAMADLVIGIDIGTGSTKGVLSDTKGNVLYSEVVRHETSFPKPGWAEHDADAV